LDCGAQFGTLHHFAPLALLPAKWKCMEMYGHVKSGILIDFDPFDRIESASNQPPTHSHAEISRPLGLRLAATITKEKDILQKKHAK
jgi:hypothetical protein